MISFHSQKEIPINKQIKKQKNRNRRMKIGFKFNKCLTTRAKCSSVKIVKFKAQLKLKIIKLLYWCFIFQTFNDAFK